ncbi:hypothetical protein GCM10028808_29230 [Spirosoma migulaei]
MNYQTGLANEIAIDPQEWRERLTSYYRETGTRSSAKQISVAMALGEQMAYTDADTLWLFMRRQKIQISRATVYKTLTWLVGAGFVHKKGNGHRTALYLIH